MARNKTVSEVEALVRETVPSLGNPEHGLVVADGVFFQAGDLPLKILLHHSDLNLTTSLAVQRYGLVYVPGKFRYFYPAVVVPDTGGRIKILVMAPRGLQENGRDRLDIEKMTITSYKRLRTRLQRLASKLNKMV